MKLLKSAIAVLATATLLQNAAFGQAERLPTNNKPEDTQKQNYTPDTRGYNPNSVRPIHESDIMYRRTIWRDIDLNEKQNRPFMAENNQITKIIFDAVMAKKLTPFTSDSLHTKMSLEEFQKNMADPNCTPPSKDDLEAEKNEVKQQFKDGWITAQERDQRLKDIDKKATTGGCESLPMRKFSLIEIKEDMIFDKKRSRMYYDIQTISVWLPASENKKTGTDVFVGSFRYKDLEKYFRNNPNAIWFNEQNNKEHKNLADAFELRLFSSMITKISNPKDDRLDVIYADKAVRPTIAAQQLEYKLMEFEHNLWEF
jgi:gliding motility associated protien GldN